LKIRVCCKLILFILSFLTHIAGTGPIYVFFIRQTASSGCSVCAPPTLFRPKPLKGMSATFVSYSHHHITIIITSSHYSSSFYSTHYRVVITRVSSSPGCASLTGLCTLNSFGVNIISLPHHQSPILILIISKTTLCSPLGVRGLHLSSPPFIQPTTGLGY